MHNFREMKIWKDAIQMSKKIYTLCESFPVSEKFGLISQIQRASVSIAANIAEGAGRGTNTDFKRFLDMSIASAYELETLLTITKEIGYINISQFELIVNDLQCIQKMIFNFKRQLN